MQTLTSPTPAELDHALTDAIHALSAVEAPSAFDATDINQLRRRIPAARVALLRAREALRETGGRRRATTPLRDDRLYTADDLTVCGRRGCAGGLVRATARTATGAPVEPLTRWQAMREAVDGPQVTCVCGALTTATSGPLVGLALASR